MEEMEMKTCIEAGMLAVLAVFLPGCATNPRRDAAPSAVVRAQRFELVNHDGDVVGVMENAEAGPRLRLLDGQGVDRVLVELRDGGPAISLCAADASPKAVLNLGSDGHPGLALVDSAGKTRYDMRLREDERPCSLFWDQHSPRPRMGVGINPKGNPNSVFFDKDFNRRAWMQLVEGEGPGFGVGTAKEAVWSSPPAP